MPVIPAFQEAEEGKSCIPGQPGLHSETMPENKTKKNC
jgi:hypothetical protein